MPPKIIFSVEVQSLTDGGIAFHFLKNMDGAITETGGMLLKKDLSNDALGHVLYSAIQRAAEADGIPSFAESVMVDNLTDHPRESSEGLWKRYGISKSLFVGDSQDFLAPPEVNKSALATLARIPQSFDFVFHDDGHGPRMLDEYRQCWALTGCLAIHDIDQFDFPAWVRSLQGVGDAYATADDRGRQLGIVRRI